MSNTNKLSEKKLPIDAHSPHIMNHKILQEHRHTEAVRLVNKCVMAPVSGAKKDNQRTAHSLQHGSP